MCRIYLSPTLYYIIITLKIAIYYDDNTLLYLGLVERLSESAAFFPPATAIGRIPFDDSPISADRAWLTYHRVINMQMV